MRNGDCPRCYGRNLGHNWYGDLYCLVCGWIEGTQSAVPWLVRGKEPQPPSYKGSKRIERLYPGKMKERE